MSTERKTPIISVIITTYNGEDVICETLDSIFSQSYQNFEVIIVDDCSKDHTVDLIKAYNEDRISLFVNETNQGSFYGLTKALSYARGKYIARSDQDDISYPERFAKQLEYMENNPDVLLCGCRNNLYFDKKRRRKTKSNGLNTPDLIGFSLLFGNYAFIHSSFFFRKKEADRLGIKYEKYPFSEDYHFLLQTEARARIGVVDKVLVGYRIHPGQFTNREPEEDMFLEDDEIIDSYSKEIGLSYELCELAKKMNRGSLSTKEEFRLMKDNILERAQEYGLDCHKDRKGISYVYTFSVFRQKIRTIWALRELLTSGLVNMNCIFSPIGLVYVAKCIFKLGR